VLGGEGVRMMLDSAKGGASTSSSWCPLAFLRRTWNRPEPRFQPRISPPFTRTRGARPRRNDEFSGRSFKVPEVLEKIKAAKNGRIDGHAPGLTGLALSAYISAGIGSDHECTTPEEALEKVRKGMCVFIREGPPRKTWRR